MKLCSCNLLSNFFLYFLLLIIKVELHQDDRYELISTELQLSDFDLSDSYDVISETTKSALLDGHGFEERVIAEKHRGTLMREQAQKNYDFKEEVPHDLMRNWTLLTKLGDLLLPKTDLDSLIEFHNRNEQTANQAKIPCLNNSSECTIGKEEVAEILAKNRNVKDLKKTWTSWQALFETNKKQFGPNLQLVEKAFIPNEEHSAKSYWEMLSEYKDGYSEAQVLWEEVQPLYKKLHEFVRIRLNNYYKINANESYIPVYLLGENFGTDWSSIADIILPHPYLYNEVETELKYQTVKDIYGLAENTTSTLGLGALGKKFWTKSDFNFNSSCGPHIFSDCDEKYTEILTCSNKLGWKEYLDIHDAAFEVALRNQDYSALPRQELRFSAANEALKGIASILAVENLPFYDFIPRGAFKSEKNEFNRKDTALLLLALRVLPKLPYYLLADTWRLEELEFSYGNFTEKWWMKRKDIQGVEGVTNLEPDFLGDRLVVSNQPYLSKFLGVFLQFQLVDYYKRHFEIENASLAQSIGSDDNFKFFVFDRPNKEWMEAVDFQYSFGKISSWALLEYFRPLEEYLDNAPLKQVVISTTAKPRTTKSTSKPTRKHSKKILKPEEPTGKNSSETSLIQNDEEQKSKDVTARANIETTTEGASQDTKTGKIGVILGVVGVICVGLIVIIVVRRLRRRHKSNNRRYET